MTLPKIEIVLDRTERAYTVGETIAGTIRIDPGEGFTCEKAIIWTEWRTTGKGPKRRGRGTGPLVLGLEPEEAATLRTLPFEIPTPPGPPTYQGKRIGLHWYVALGTETVGKRPLVVRERIALLPGEEGQVTTIGPGMEEIEKSKSYKGGSYPIIHLGCSTLLFILGAPGPLLLVLTWGSSGVFAKILLGLWSLAALPLLVLSVGEILMFLAATLDKRRLGDVRWSIEPRKLRRGESLRSVLSIRPSREITIRNVEAKLTARETASAGKRGWKLLEKSFDLGTEHTLKGGEEFRLEESIQVPPDGPWSIAIRFHNLVWDVSLQMKLGDHPIPWLAKIRLVVLP